MGVVPPIRGFLETLREAADDSGALLIFDEVITGFRVARGGAQERYAIRPDLTILGKIIGGGLPAAAYGGRRDYMERIAPAGDVYQAGTLSGNPLATAAALATLCRLDAAAYGRLRRPTTETLATGLREAAAAADARVQIQSLAPGLLTVFFSDGPVDDYAGAARSTPRPTPRGAADCSAGASIRRRRNSRPGSLRLRTPRPTCGGRLTRLPRRSRRRRPMRTARDGAHALRDALRGEGGQVAACLADPLADRPADSVALDRPGPAQVAATGPRTRGRASEYEVLLEMILEGYRLHYDEPLVVRPDDADLALLLGDQLYALGLARLAELGDLEAVAELADVISLAAQARPTPTRNWRARSGRPARCRSGGSQRGARRGQSTCFGPVVRLAGSPPDRHRAGLPDRARRVGGTVGLGRRRDSIGRLGYRLEVSELGKAREPQGVELIAQQQRQVGVVGANDQRFVVVQPVALEDHLEKPVPRTRSARPRVRGPGARDLGGPRWSSATESAGRSASGSARHAATVPPSPRRASRNACAPSRAVLISAAPPRTPRPPRQPSAARRPRSAQAKGTRPRIATAADRRPAGAVRGTTRRRPRCRSARRRIGAVGEEHRGPGRLWI